MRSPCLGLCDYATAALLQEAGPLPREEVIRELTLTKRARFCEAARRRASPSRAGRARCARVAMVRADDGDADAAAAAGLQRRRRAQHAAVAASRRHDRSDRHRRVHDVRRIRGASSRARDRPRRRDPRGDRLEADGPRRRGVSDGTQMGGGREAVGASALPHLQRRRIRAGHVQGSRAARRRSVRDRRSDDDRRVRDRLRARLPLHSRRVSGRRRALRSARSHEAHAHGFLGNDILGRGVRVRHRDPPRRRRVHLRRRDGDLQLDRRLSRRAAQQAAVPGAGRAVRLADGRQQRRDARQRAVDRARTAARRSRASAPSSRPARSCSA